MSGALGEQITIDPDLAGMNRAKSAAAGRGTTWGERQLRREGAQRHGNTEIEVVTSG